MFFVECVYTARLPLTAFPKFDLKKVVAGCKSSVSDNVVFSAFFKKFL